MAMIIDNLKQSWKAYRKFFQVIITALLVAAIPSAAAMGIGFLVVSDFSFSNAQNLITETYFSEAQYSWEEKAVPAELESLWFYGFMAVSLFISMYFLAGTYAVYLGAVRGKANMNLFWQSLDARGVSLVISKILVGLVFAGLAGLFLVPGVIFAAVLEAFGAYSAASGVLLIFMLGCLIVGIMIAPFFAVVSPSVVSGKSPINAFKESFFIGRKNYRELMGLIFVIILLLASDVVVSMINSIAGMAFSFAFVSPMMGLILASFYVRHSETGNAEKELRPSKKEKLPVKKVKSVRKK